MTRQEIVKHLGGVISTAREWSTIMVDGRPDDLDIAIAFGEIAGRIEALNYALVQIDEDVPDLNDIPF